MHELFYFEMPSQGIFIKVSESSDTYNTTIVVSKEMGDRWAEAMKEMATEPMSWKFLNMLKERKASRE